MAIVTDSIRKVIYGQHDSDFVQTVSNFFMQQYYSDIVFICKKNVQVKAHKIVLASVSEFISRMVSDNHYEETLYISVPDVDHNKLQLFLTVIYKGLVQIEREDMETLKELAYFLNIPLKNATFAIVNSNTDSHVADRIKNVNNSDMPMRNVTSTDNTDFQADTTDNTNDSDETVYAARDVLVKSHTPMQVKENMPSTSLETSINKPQTETSDFIESDKNTFQSDDIDRSSAKSLKKNSFRPSVRQKKKRASESSARESLNGVPNLRNRSFRVISTRKRGRICLKIQSSSVQDIKKSPSKLHESTLGGNSAPVHNKEPRALLSEEEFASVPCPLKQTRLRVAAEKESLIRDDKGKSKNKLLNQAVNESVTCRPGPDVIGNADQSSESNTFVSESDSVKNKTFNSSSNRTPSHTADDMSKITKENMKSVKIILSDIVTSPVIRRQEVVPSSVGNPAASQQLSTLDMPTDTHSTALKELETSTVNTSVQNNAVKSYVQPSRRINRNRLNVLLEEYQKNPFITKERLKEVAKKLNTSRGSIRAWFYRMRKKHAVPCASTNLNEKQKKLAALKQEYEKCHFTTKEQRMEIARKLNISYGSVTSLFYRMQKKRRVSDGSTVQLSANKSSIKRKRMIRRVLLREFEKNHFPTIEQRMEMAKRLNVSYNSVKFWFYRMRSKHLGRSVSERAAAFERKKKLKKLTFAKEQFLLQEYARNESATEQEQKEIASRLNVPCEIVFSWFSDRQKKERGTTSVSESVKSSTSPQSGQKKEKEKLSPLQQKYEKNHFSTNDKQMELARKLNVSYDRMRMKDTGGTANESVKSSTSTFLCEENGKKKLSALKEKFLLREYTKNKSATEEEQKEIASRLNLPCDIVISWFSERQKKERGTLVSGNVKSSTSTRSGQKEEKEKLSVQNERRLSLEYTKNKTATEEEQKEIARKLRLSCELVFSWFSDRQKKERDWLSQEEPSTSQTIHHNSSLQVGEEEEEDPSTREIYLTKEYTSLPGTSILPMSIKGDTLSSYPYSDTPMSSVSSSSGSFSILQQIPIKNEFSADLESSEHKNNSPTGSTLSVDYVGLHTASRSYYKGEPIVMIYKNINED